jgi:hypothetical protein
VKDRAALGVVRDAEDQGLSVIHLSPTTARPFTLLQAKIGRDRCRRDGREHWHWTGACVQGKRIQMRHIHAQHPGALSPPSSATPGPTDVNIQSQEKIDLLRMLGAEVHAVPAVAYENPANYNHLARDHAKGISNAIWTNQFDNTANAYAHYISTGPEIWEQTHGELDGFICSTGTGGTLAGVGKYLKEKSHGKTQVWLADPPGSVLTSYITSGGKLTERSGSSITEGMIEPTANRVR